MGGAWLLRLLWLLLVHVITVRAGFEADIKADIEADILADIEADIKADIIADIKADIAADIKAEIQTEIKAEHETYIMKPYVPLGKNEEYGKGIAIDFSSDMSQSENVVDEQTESETANPSKIGKDNKLYIKTEPFHSKSQPDIEADKESDNDEDLFSSNSQLGSEADKMSDIAVDQSSTNSQSHSKTDKESDIDAELLSSKNQQYIEADTQENIEADNNLGIRGYRWRLHENVWAPATYRRNRTGVIPDTEREGVMQMWINAAQWKDFHPHDSAIDDVMRHLETKLHEQSRTNVSDIPEYVFQSMHEFNADRPARVKAIKLEKRRMKQTSINTRKRSIAKFESSRWTKGIVPFQIESDVSDPGVNEITRAMLTYERLTCIRFVHSSTINEHDLDHINFLRFVRGGSCWSYVGNVRSTNGQPLSCCSWTTCVHEIGHGLGLIHEQGSPDDARLWMIRINPENINLGAMGQYIQYSKQQIAGMVGYDIASFMHYSDSFFSNGKGKTFTKLYSEAKESTDHYYMMKEVSLAHKCETERCASVNKDCENDGYLTLVDNKCKCRCVPGLNPDTDCRTILRPTTSTQNWPSGSYSLPRPKAGCADSSSGRWGSRTHYTGGNTFSDDFDIAGQNSEEKIEQTFCTTSNKGGNDVWPAGSYCIYRKGNTCPQFFSPGYVQYSDAFTSQQGSSGNLPDGIFSSGTTRLYYCCRNDGFYWEEIFPPTTKPFALIKYGRYPCQYVRGMHVYDQSYTIKNARSGHSFWGAHPLSDDDGLFYTTTFCYYKKAEVDCGDVINLTPTSPVRTIQSPSGSELDCTWYIKSPENKNIKLKFDMFNIASTGDNCKDLLEIRYFRPGQEGFYFCGTTLDRTFQSVNNTIVIRLSTYGTTSSGFEATASIIHEEDLCYDTSDRGTSYVGEVGVTRFFEPCLKWTDVAHCAFHAYQESSAYPLLEGNYCRNPTYDAGRLPWCYISEQCDRNYCDPCLFGDIYDAEEYCDLVKEHNLCSHLASVEMTSSCAKTCGFTLPAAPGSITGISCPSPSQVPDGTITEGAGKSSYDVGETVTYTCNTQSGITKTRTCLTSGQWSEMGFTCSLCPTGWPYRPKDNHCYNMPRHHGHHDDVRDSCPDGFMKIKNIDDNYFLLNISWTFASSISATRFYEPWVGVKKDNGGRWKWHDGAIAQWTNWKKGEPDTTENHCAKMSRFGEWFDSSCNINGNYICAKDAFQISFCADMSHQCITSFESNPSMCDTTLAELCPLSCGLCHNTPRESCNVDPAGDNVLKDTTAVSVFAGTRVTYSCRPGYNRVWGDYIRGCMQSGHLSGYPLMCERCPSGWTYFEGNGNCYRLFGQMKFDEALENCRNQDAFLAMPKTKLENEFIVEFSNGERTWIGIHDSVSGQEGVFYYADGSLVIKFQSWRKYQPQQPNGGTGENCVMIGVFSGSGEWWDAWCDGRNQHICQIAMSTIYPPPVTTPRPTTSPQTTSTPTTSTPTTSTSTTPRPTTSTTVPTTSTTAPISTTTSTVTTTPQSTTTPEICDPFQ